MNMTLTTQEPNCFKVLNATTKFHARDQDFICNALSINVRGENYFILTWTLHEMAFQFMSIIYYMDMKNYV